MSKVNPSAQYIRLSLSHHATTSTWYQSQNRPSATLSNSYNRIVCTMFTWLALQPFSDLSWLSSVPPGKCWNSTSKYVTTASFHTLVQPSDHHGVSWHTASPSVTPAVLSGFLHTTSVRWMGRTSGSATGDGAAQSVVTWQPRNTGSIPRTGKRCSPKRPQPAAYSMGTGGKKLANQVQPVPGLRMRRYTSTPLSTFKAKTFTPRITWEQNELQFDVTASMWRHIEGNVR